MTYTGLIVVVPTRNRSGLAADSIRSVLSESRSDIAVLISDNSTMDEEAEKLSAFCRQLGDARVYYARPPSPLPMADNWEWALRQAMQLPHASHFLYLTDRFVFKRQEFGRLLRLASCFADKVISYTYDTVNDCKQPPTLEQVAWSGSLLDLTSDELLVATAELKWQFYDCLPRMLNSIVPRATLEAIHQKYGNVFLSTAPDLCFAYRFLERFDSFLYFDKAVLVQYALSRSHGYSQGHGKVTDEYLDVLADLKGATINNAAPIPGVNTNMNTVFHEYCLAKEQSRSPKFPEVNKANYFRYLFAEIRRFEDSQRKDQTLALLEAYRGAFGSAQRGERGNWSGPAPKIIKFPNPEDAVTYAFSHTRARNWRASTEELNAHVRLVPQADDLLLLHTRFYVVHAWSHVKMILRRVTNLIDAASAFYDRYVGWRFRS